VHLTGLELAVALAVVVVGGFVQGSIGFGLNLVCVPVIAMLEPDAVPGAVLLISLPMTATMAIHERRHIDWPGVGALALGRVPGTVAGLALLHWLTGDDRLLLVGIAVLVATVATARAPEFARRAATQIPAGFATGVSGTVAGIDGPPMALLYQHAPAPTVRATLATMFAFGGVVSAIGAALTGDLEGWHLLVTLALMPGVALGHALAHRVRHRIPAHWFRTAVLVLVGVAGCVTTARGIW
jgi:uncharacterized membrane protein YfcA